MKNDIGPETRPKQYMQYINDLDTRGKEEKRETKDFLEKDSGEGKRSSEVMGRSWGEARMVVS